MSGQARVILGIKFYRKKVLAVLYSAHNLVLGDDVRIDDCTVISGKVTLSADEGPKSGVTVEGLEKLKLAFMPGGMVTPGTAQKLTMVLRQSY